MATRYARRRVFLSVSGFDEPIECVILSSHKDSGEWFYRIRLIEGGIFDVTARSIDWIGHRKSRVVQLNKHLRKVK